MLTVAIWGKAAADSRETEYVLSEIESLLKGSAPYDILIKCTYSDDGTGLSRRKRQTKHRGAPGTTGTENKGSVCDGSINPYYIVNAVHAVITSKELIKQIAELPNVERSHRTIKLNWSSRSKMTRNPKRHHIQFGIQFLNRMKEH